MSTVPVTNDGRERAAQSCRAATAVSFRDDLASIVIGYGASLRLGFKGRFAYLQAQWPGAEEALSLLRAENYDSVQYLTEEEEASQPDDEPTPRARRLEAERLELAFTAVQMRHDIDALVERTGRTFRLTSDAKRAWVCVRANGEWVPVIRCRKGQPPEVFDETAALTVARPDITAIRRGLRRTLRHAKHAS